MLITLLYVNILALAGANNLIPMEIALKIAAKIKANERFAVYVVIPMWPEGVPTGPTTQRILFWQVWFNTQYEGQTSNFGKDLDWTVELVEIWNCSHLVVS